MMDIMTREELKLKMYSLRENLESVFSYDTAMPGAVSGTPSSGHCAVVALIIAKTLKAEIRSAIVNGESRWYNSFYSEDGNFEVDLTGDQFGFAPVQISQHGGQLYSKSRNRLYSDANSETQVRAEKLLVRLERNMKHKKDRLK